jgi:hypothetical protein
MGQAIDLIRLFGLMDLVRKKRRHDKALPLLRGYCATTALWAMFDTGVMDALKRGPASAPELAESLKLDARVLDFVLDYLDCVRVVRRGPRGRYALDRLGRALVEEPRGAFDLACGYAGVMAELTALVRGDKKYARDVFRREAFVAKGSGELGAQLPFPVMADIIRRAGFRVVLDLGSGDLEFLFTLCRELPELRAYGVDVSPDAAALARGRLAASPFRDRIVVEQADMFHLDALLERRQDVDVMTACDVFHEHLSQGAGKVEGLLARLREKAPKAAMLVAEFCRQPHERLRRRPTAFVEHHLWHNLTNQVILSADEWRAIFRRSGWTVAEERVFDLVGHGYFLLR